MFYSNLLINRTLILYETLTQGQDLGLDKTIH